MSILLTGGTGNTATFVADQLKAAGIPYALTSRRGQDGVSGHKAIKFDWNDQSTFANVFENETFQAIYLIPPPGTSTPAEQMNPFIDLAVEKGVKRFVLLAGGTATKGGHYTGQVWAHMASKNVEISVLKPHWFLQNFLSPLHINTIKSEGKFYSGSKDGKAPWIAVEDISAVAFQALTSPKPVGEEIGLCGPELLSFDDIAAKMSAVLGRKIEHVKYASQEENRQALLKLGLDDFTAGLYARLEEMTAQGDFGSPTWLESNAFPRLQGKEPMSANEWLEKHKGAFV